MAFRDKVLVFSQPGALAASQLEDLVEAVKGIDMEEVHAQIAEQQSFLRPVVRGPGLIAGFAGIHHRHPPDRPVLPSDAGPAQPVGQGMLDLAIPDPSWPSRIPRSIRAPARESSRLPGLAPSASTLRAAIPTAPQRPDPEPALTRAPSPSAFTLRARKVFSRAEGFQVGGRPGAFLI